jgi:hypothetical protein
MAISKRELLSKAQLINACRDVITNMGLDWTVEYTKDVKDPTVLIRHPLFAKSHTERMAKLIVDFDKYSCKGSTLNIVLSIHPVGDPSDEDCMYQIEVRRDIKEEVNNV